MRARHDDYGGTLTPHWQSHRIGSHSKIQLFERGNDERAESCNRPDPDFSQYTGPPITAISNGDQDGNDATERGAGWQPLNATPMHLETPFAGGNQRGRGARRSGSSFRQRAGRLRRDRYFRRAP